MHQTTITFPELRLSPRDGHKLRGYFSQLFGEQSDLWHNHNEEGKPIYRYPLIQYKVVRRQPMLIGLGEGAPLLIQHFMAVSEIDIDGLRLPVHSKQAKSRVVNIGVDGQLHRYQFENPWFALNQEHFVSYQKLSAREQEEKLRSILVGHILAFFKGVDHWEEQSIMTTLLEIKPVAAKFKNRSMMMFKGGFVSNVLLPDYIGLGKSVSRGFGSIRGLSP
jgi:hypothetical protein